MKNQLLLAFFALISFSSFSQYSRSIYTEEFSHRRYSSIYSYNNETTVISIRESSIDTLRVMLIDIDESGETSNYRKYELTPFDISPGFLLSGVGVNSSGEVTLCVLAPNSSGNVNINYVTIDPVSGVFSNFESIINQYREGFSRTRAKVDSLITYLASSVGSGLQRVARSVSSTGISIENCDPGSTYSGSMFQNTLECELYIDGTNEYVAIGSKIFKRTSVNNYLQTAHQSFFGAPCLTLNTSGELFVLKRYNGELEKFDSNLNLISSGSVANFQFSPNSLTEIYALSNNEIRLWVNSNSSQSKIIDLDGSNSIINEQFSRSIPLDQLILDGKQYVVGFDYSFASPVDFEGNSFQTDPSSITIVSDDLSSDLPDFIEFNQVLTTDKIQFRTNHAGRSFNEQLNGTAGFHFHQNNQWRSLIYSAAENFMGQTISSILLGNNITYSSSAVTGPYCSPGDFNMETMDKYNRGYFVTREMIESHIIEITSGNPLYKIPFGIKEWPAHGDVSLGQASNLASFFDQNGNGTYEPELGDYPSIYGDQCLLNIYHQHPNSANSSSIETHQYYFTFDCDSEEAIENTVFVRSHNFSRSETLFNTYSGNYVDFDIGNYNDDYIGTNVELGMIYSYNGDLFDETNGGNAGFNDTIPAAGLLTLQGVKLDEDGLDNSTPISGGPISNGIGFADGIPDNEYFTMESSYALTSLASGMPNSNSTWYNVMQGYKPDGSPKQVNGVNVRHDFFGTSDPLFYTSDGVDHGNNNSEDSLGNPVSDRRFSCASGSAMFNTVDTMVLINAFVVGVDTVNLSPSNSVTKLFEHGQTLRDFYAQDISPCGNTFDVYIADNQLSIEENELQLILIYPNPANQHIQFRGINGQASLDIFDLNGRMVLSESDIDDNQSIDISFLDKAIYLIRISDKNGIQTIRMIKQ